MTPSADQPLHFGEFRLDLQTRRLFKGEVVQRIGERAFDLLCVLATPPLKRHRAEALRQRVWGDTDVGLNNLRVQIAGLRKLLGRDAISFQITKGYRFELPVQQGEASAATQGSAEPDVRLGNLPEDLAPLWGRDAMLDELVASIATSRLITLKGLGGAGKTAVALAGARGAAPAFADGVWWVDLAPLASGALVLGAVASSLQRVLPEDGPLAALGASLASQRLLLVLDNCEHVTPAVAELCDHLLRAAAGVHLLCTSRVPLKAAGERVWPVGALDLPDDASLSAARDSGAVALFEARALAADGRFKLTAANVASVVEICRRLDGLAFALVLAAARVPVLGVSGVLRHLDERLSWEQREGRAPEARHLSLQATLDWSHGLLSAVEQQVLRRLAVFAGSFSLDAVLHLVTDDVLDTSALLKALQGLVDHSLLVIEAQALLEGNDTAPRYTMHESVRMDARQRLQASDEHERLHDAHAAYYATVSQQLRRDTQQGRRSSSALQHDLDNLRAAIAWSTEHHPPQAMALCSDCNFTFRKLGYHAEARRNLQRLLALPFTPEQAVIRADLLMCLCGIDFEHEAADAVLASADAALQLLLGRNEPARSAAALAWKATAHLSRVEMPQAEALYRQVLAECRRADDAEGARDALVNLGFVIQSQGRHDEARSFLHEAADLHARHGDEWGLMLVNENLGELELAAGRPAEAALYHESAVMAARHLGHQFRLAYNLAYLGLARRRLGQPAQARACLREALQISQHYHLERVQADACGVLAGALLETGQPARATALARAARLLFERYRVTPLPSIESDLARTETLAAATLDAHARHSALAQGETLTSDDVLIWAMP